MSSEQYTPFGSGRDIMPDGTTEPVTSPPATTSSDISVSRIPSFSFDDDEGDVPDEPARRLNWRVVVAGVVVLALIVGVVVWRTRPTATPIQYTNGTVTQGNLAVTISATGPLNGQIYNLNFTATGTVSEVDVQVGQTVTQGQVLAKIDPTSLQNALNSAQAQMNSAQIGYNNAQTSLSDAQKNQANSDALAQDAYNATVNPGSGKTAPTSQQIQQAQDQLNASLTQAQNSVDSAEGQIASAQAQVASAQAQVQTAQDNMSQATLTAPSAGEVTIVNGSVGGSSASTSSSGSSGSSPFIQIANLSSLQIAAQVNEADIGNVNTGQAVSFTVEAFPSDTFYGSVVAVSPLSQTTSNVVTYPVTVAVDSQSASQARLFPGMTASVTITTQQAIGALLVPNTALSYARSAVTAGHVSSTAARTAITAAQAMITNTTDGSLSQGTASYVLEMKQGKLTAIPVVIGLANSTETVVLAGLNQGDVVLTGDNQSTGTTTTTTTTRNGGGSFGGGFGGFAGGGR